jgi:hypothetical protein
MKWWIKFGCFLTGWNSHILSYCSEASFKHLKKYTAALLILILLWGFTGYCFADRYVAAPWWGCALSALAFIIIVIQIERQIILMVGRHRWVAVFRCGIAVIMAILGSSIIDQIIFAKDINLKMNEIRVNQIDKLLPRRLSVIDSRLTELKLQVDSLEQSNMRLTEKVEKKPVVQIIDTKIERDSLGRIVSTTITKTNAPNPIFAQIARNDTLLKNNRVAVDTLTNQRIKARDDLEHELRANQGFLEELDAMLSILGERTGALIFYLLIFAFLISLELFVVVSKFADDECDYDLIIEHQLKMKRQTLVELVKDIDK